MSYCELNIDIFKALGRRRHLWEYSNENQRIENNFKTLISVRTNTFWRIFPDAIRNNKSWFCSLYFSLNISCCQQIIDKMRQKQASTIWARLNKLGKLPSLYEVTKLCKILFQPYCAVKVVQILHKRFWTNSKFLDFSVISLICVPQPHFWRESPISRQLSPQTWESVVFQIPPTVWKTYSYSPAQVIFFRVWRREKFSWTWPNW